MKKNIFFLGLILLSLSFQSLVVRHDVSDKKFIELAKNYPQICHFPMGEGTLIDSMWILTAAHVASELKSDAGFSSNAISNGKEYEIDKVVLHPKYSFTGTGIKNDIALVKIKSAISDITPAAIYDKYDETGKEIVIVGRGDVGTGISGPQKRDKITRVATNRIDHANDLWISFSFDAPDSENVTALEGVSGPGDSGGPAFIEVNGVRYIIGISSHQMNYGDQGPGKYGAVEHYARVSSYHKWISDTMNE